MASMERYDVTFKQFDTKLELNGNYDSANINFNCLREVIDSYELKCGKISDYGLMYVKNFVEACEKYDTPKVVSSLEC